MTDVRLTEDEARTLLTMTVDEPWGGNPDFDLARRKIGAALRQRNLRTHGRTVARGQATTAYLYVALTEDEARTLHDATGNFAGSDELDLARDRLATAISGAPPIGRTLAPQACRHCNEVILHDERFGWTHTNSKMIWCGGMDAGRKAEP